MKNGLNVYEAACKNRQGKREREKARESLLTILFFYFLIFNKKYINRMAGER
jgi:hypothetical protein